MSAARFCSADRPGHRPAHTHHFASDRAHRAVEVAEPVAASDSTPCGWQGSSLRDVEQEQTLTPICSSRMPPRLCSRSRFRPPLSSPLSATIAHPRCRPIGGSGLPSSPHQAAPICSSSRRPATLGATVHRTSIFFRTGHRRLPCSVLLRVNQQDRELLRHPLLCTNPKFRSGSHWSEQPLSSTLPPTTSPSIGHSSKPLSSQPPPIDSPLVKLPPQLLMLRHLAASLWDFTGKTMAGKGKFSLCPLLMGRKA
jgi:hypothetical protein